MKYRTLGKTGLRVSVIGVGTWQLGGEWGKHYTVDEVADILAAAKAEGINLIDTAECYGDHLSESLIGKAIEGEREKWIVATKFGHKFHGFMHRTDHFGAGDALRQLEGSLAALKTDYVDLLQFHSGPNEAFDNDELWTALEKAVRDGKVRFLGISVGKPDNMHQVEGAERVGARAIQIVYNRLNNAAGKAILPYCAENGLGVLARVPLAGGVLSGKYEPGHKFPSGDYRAKWAHEEVKQKELSMVEEIRHKEVPHGVSLPEWSIAWCLKNPAVSCVIPGCKSVDQVLSNARAADLEI